MATKVSLINMKGGVGKSTLTINLAWHFACYSEWARRVLVVDLDPQFNSSQYLLGVSEYEGILNAKKPTVWEILEQGIRTPSGISTISNPRDTIYKYRKFSHGGCLHLIPSRLELSLSLKNPGNKERNLPRLVTAIESDYDLILIDCAPTESMLTTAAYLTSDYLLVPVKPEYLSTIGLPLLANSMQDFKDEYPTSTLELAGVVFNATSDYLPEETVAKDTVRKLATKNGWYVFQNEVDYSRSYPKGAREGKPIFGTSYSRMDKVLNFQLFAREFAKQVKL